jgi:hypothetical protein
MDFFKEYLPPLEPLVRILEKMDKGKPKDWLSVPRISSLHRDLLRPITELIAFAPDQFTAILHPHALAFASVMHKIVIFLIESDSPTAKRPLPKSFDFHAVVYDIQRIGLMILAHLTPWPELTSKLVDTQTSIWLWNAETPTIELLSATAIISGMCRARQSTRFTDGISNPSHATFTARTLVKLLDLGIDTGRMSHRHLEDSLQIFDILEHGNVSLYVASLQAGFVSRFGIIFDTWTSRMNKFYFDNKEQEPKLIILGHVILVLLHQEGWRFIPDTGEHLAPSLWRVVKYARENSLSPDLISVWRRVFKGLTLMTAHYTILRGMGSAMARYAERTCRQESHSEGLLDYPWLTFCETFRKRHNDFLAFRRSNDIPFCDYHQVCSLRILS